MQIIQKIREKGAAIVIAIIALSLIGFILMDANLGANRMSASGSTKIGEINGVSVDSKEYQEKIKQVEEQFGGRVGAAQQNMVRQSAWDQLVAEKVFTAEFEKLGLIFSPKELSSIMFSEDAPQTLKQAFTDKTTGQYDVAKVQQWWQSAKKMKGEQRASIESQIVEPIKLQAQYSKYSSLLAASAYYPSWMKEKENADNNNFANISFVAVPYNVISDSSITVSDNDITAYVTKHKVLYEQEGGRQLSYISFSSNPSAADTLKAYESTAALKAPFIADTNAKSFVARNMSSREYADAYVVKSKITGVQKDSLITLASGAVYGPYLDGSQFVLAKMIGSRQLPDSVKCRHILIGTVDPQTGTPLLADSIAKVRIDSIEAAIKGGADFAAMALKYSDDQGSKNNGGMYDFPSSEFTRMARGFSEAIFYGNTGDKKVIHTEFGWHYIEVLNQKNFEQAYKIAYVSKDIIASDETINSASVKASKLSAEARNAKAAEAYVVKNGLQKIDIPTLAKENDYSFGGLQDARQMIKWAFEAKEGDVSEPFNISDQFVVAVLNKIHPKGLPDAKTARPLVETIVRNEKKAAQIKTKLGASPTLESAAAAYAVQVASAGADSTLTFNSTIINGVGQEPKVIGAAFNKAYQAKVSEPITGNNAVYIIKVNSVAAKAAETAEVAEARAKDRARALTQQMSFGWFESLKKLASVKDDRSKLF
ncbi:MAG: hypothetical protein RL172_2403 [Bacteroidota bacterium]|jgi:peptidyl-prolyl cis-trans isomerase D